MSHCVERFSTKEAYFFNRPFPLFLSLWTKWWSTLATCCGRTQRSTRCSTKKFFAQSPVSAYRSLSPCTDVKSQNRHVSLWVSAVSVVTECQSSNTEMFLFFIAPLMYCNLSLEVVLGIRSWSRSRQLLRLWDVKSHFRGCMSHYQGHCQRHRYYKIIHC